MEKQDQFYDEVDVGDSYPSYSQLDFDDEIFANTTSPENQIEGGVILSEEIEKKDAIYSHPQIEYEHLLNLVVPDSEDDDKGSVPHVKFDRRFPFGGINETKCDACTTPMATVADSDNEEDDYVVLGDFEKLLGVFCPTFKDLTPRRRKTYFPKK